MRSFAIIVFIGISIRASEPSPGKFHCLNRFIKRIKSLFKASEIVAYEPQNSDRIQGFTSFMRSAIYQPEKLMKREICLDEINQRDKNGKTVLHWLSQHGKENSIPLLQKLVELKADINVQSNNGDTPLMCSIHAPFPEIIMQLLIEMRADIRMHDNFGNNVKKLIAESELIHDKNVLYALLEEQEKESSCTIE
jgi:ankyrin repeat protein